MSDIKDRCPLTTVDEVLMVISSALAVTVTVAVAAARFSLASA